jgi:uncharacterized membrane protein YheB (UPF0754 family)
MRDVTNPNTMNITMKSQLTGVEHTLEIDITENQLSRILNRFGTKELIQNIVPNLSIDEREFLITGITKEEWSDTFGETFNRI